MWTFVKIIIWGILWYPVWLVTLPLKGKKNNCLIWALDKFDEEDGYLCIRWCRSNKIPFIKWPHFLWLPEEHHEYLQHIVPAGEVQGEEHKLPVPWFPVEHRMGDPKSMRDEN